MQISPERITKIRVISLCIAAAATFWFLNALNDTYTTSLKYPVQFIYDTEKYIAVKEMPKEVNINVSGMGWNLFRNSLGIKVTPLNFRLENPTEIKKISGASLLGTISDQMDELQVNFVLTDTLYLNLDRRATRTFKLEIDSASINLEDNFWISTPIRFTPDSVVLHGPELALNKFEESIVVQIPQNKIDENYNEDIPIEFENSRLIKRDPPTMNVIFGVEKFSENSIMVPAKTQNFPANGKAFVENPAAKINYLVADGRADAVVSDDFEVLIDYNNINPKDSTITIQLLKYPSMIKEVVLDSATVKVKFNE